MHIHSFEQPGNQVNGVDVPDSSIQETLTTISRRIEEIDRIGHELIHVGSEQKTKAETVISESLGRIEQTTEVIQNNITRSSNEIAELTKDIQTAVKQSVLPKPSQVA